MTCYNERLHSFTETVLLNGRVLNFICPSNCEKKKIKDADKYKSINALFENSANDISPVSIKTGTIHWITKPVKAVLRAAFIGSVLLTVSPCGAFYNGLRTIGHFLHYSIKYVKGENDLKEKWNKINIYASIFFTDFYSFGSGLATTIGSLSLYYLIKKRSGTSAGKFLFFTAGILSLGGYFSGGYSPSHYLARLLANSELKSGMYLALELKNQLGLVDQEGNLLNFSPTDQLSFRLVAGSVNKSYHFYGANIKLLSGSVIKAEIDLIDLVKEVNEWLHINNFIDEIKFTYPFNGREIAEKLEKDVKKLQADNREINEVLQLIDKLKKIDYKINSLRDIFFNSLRLTMVGSMQPEITLQGKFQTNPRKSLDERRTIDINKKPSFLTYLNYKNYFEREVFQMDRKENPTNDKKNSFDFSHSFDAWTSILATSKTF